MVRPVSSQFLRLELTITRKDVQYDDEVDVALRKWNDKMQEWSIEMNGNPSPVGIVPFQYLNYAAPFQDPLANYGDMSHHMLREVSKKYDPDQVFQRLVPGGFKLNRV